jgi:hypothetical protein
LQVKQGPSLEILAPVLQLLPSHYLTAQELDSEQRELTEYDRPDDEHPIADVHTAPFRTGGIIVDNSAGGFWGFPARGNRRSAKVGVLNLNAKPRKAAKSGTKDEPRPKVDSPIDPNGEPTIAVFFVALDQPMGLRDGLELYYQRTREPVPWVQFNGGYNFVRMKIWRVPDQLPLQLHKYEMAFSVAKKLTKPSENPEGIQFGNVPLPSSDVLGTVMELATPVLDAPSGTPEEAISEAFDRCLEELNLFMRAYLTVTHDRTFRPITRQTCRPLVPWATQDLHGRYGHLGVFMVREGVGQIPYAHDDLTEEQQRKLQIVWRQTTAGYPFIPFVERARVAYREYDVEGDYPTTVIAAYTACEVLLNTALFMMAWEEGKTRDETRPWFEARLEFMNRVSREIQPRLGGNWANPPNTSPMGQLRILSDIRQKVVHLAYTPSEKEAQEALQALGVLEEFVKQRLAAKRMKYPRTCLLLNGEPGLRRRRAWDARIEKWVEEHAGTEDEWGVSYRLWRDQPPTP